MNTPNLCGRLLKLGVLLTAEGDQLLYDAPAGVLTPEILAELKAEKGQITAYLRGESAHGSLQHSRSELSPNSSSKEGIADPRQEAVKVWQAALTEVSSGWNAYAAKVRGTAGEPLWLDDEHLAAEVDHATLAGDLPEAIEAIDRWRRAWLQTIDPAAVPVRDGCSHHVANLRKQAQTLDAHRLFDLIYDPATKPEAREAYREEILARADAVLAKSQEQRPPATLTTATFTDQNGALVRERYQVLTGAIVSRGDTMNVSKFVSSYLKAADLKQPVNIVIDRVEEQTFEREGQQESKLVLYPKGGSQGVVLAKTQIEQLVEILGSGETDDWVGQKVTMYADPTVTFRGRKVGGIRFKSSSRPKPTEEEPENPENPF